jgi:molybdate transport system substrate-binding protein
MRRLSRLSRGSWHRRDRRSALLPFPFPFPLLLVLLLLLLLLVGVGCQPGDAGREADAPLLVLGASDLLFAFEELVPLYEERTGERLDLVLGSTGNLTAQIRNGAPADLFFSANEAFLDDLIVAGRIDPESRRIYAVGRLAMVVPPEAILPEGPAHLIDERFGTIAIANPEHAPYGWAAREAFRSLGIWDAIEPRLVLGENVAHALQFVRTGNADGGIVALSLVMGTEGEAVPYRVVDDGLHARMLQVAGVVVDTPHRDRAIAFLEFVLSEEGQELLERYGFEPLPGGG